MVARLPPASVSITDDQVQRWVPSALTQEVIWCQLFSEPDAGSDLANVKTTAVLDGDTARISAERSRLVPVVQAVHRLRKLSGLHALGRACGIDAGDPRHPLLPIAGSEQRDLARLAEAFDDVEDGVLR